MNEKSRKTAIAIAAILDGLAMLYLGGLIAQVLTNYQTWMDSGGMWGAAQMAPPDWNPIRCIPSAFTWNGLKGMALFLAGVAESISM